VPTSGRTRRESAQRTLVRQVIENSMDHPTAQAIFEKARRRMRSISLGTVYRNLQLLVAEGTVVESKIGKKPARYEANRRRHYHVCCVQCGALEDVPFPYQTALDRRVGRMIPYLLREHRMEFYGICPRCQAKPGGRRRAPNRLDKPSQQHAGKALTLAERALARSS